MPVYEFQSNGDATVKLLDKDGNPADANGMLTEIGAPDIVKTMDTDLRIGEGGGVNRPTTFEAMTSDMTLKGISPDFYRYVAIAQANDYPISIQVTGKGQDRYSSSTIDLKIVLKGFVAKLPIFKVTAGEKSEMSMTLAVNAVTQEIGGTRVYFEPAARKYEINGVNQWKE